MKKLEVICCFCGQSLLFNKAIEITVNCDANTGDLQAIYAHSKCLDNLLHKSVPRLFDVN